MYYNSYIRREPFQLVDNNSSKKQGYSKGE